MILRKLQLPKTNNSRTPRLTRKKHLSDLSIGSTALVQDAKTNLWDRSGLVKAVRPNKLSYVIDLDGREVIRSRRMLKTDCESEDKLVS